MAMSVENLKTSRNSCLVLACFGAGILAMAVFFGHLLSSYVYGLMDLQNLAYNALMQDGLIVVVIFAYIVMIAFPFVPGAEIGVALLLMFGAPIAGVLYLATVVALILSFLAGRLLPTHLLAKILKQSDAAHTACFLSENRGSTYLTKFLTGDRHKGTQHFCRVVNWLVQHRLYALAALINTPGNTLIGGGGGIALAAGVSRKISFREFLICISFAVAPVPAIVTIVAWIGN